MTNAREPTFTLLIFTLNEIDGCKIILPKIDRSLFTQILVVDANSIDGTPEWCQEQGFEVFSQSRTGLRQAYLEVLPHIRGDYMIAFSPDGNSLTDKLPELVAKLKEGYDMVIVSRYLGEAKSADDNIITGFGNWMFTSLVNLLHRGHYTDVMVMYRGLRTSLMHDLRLDDPDDFIPKWTGKIFFATMGNEPLMSARAARAGYKVGEIAGDEPPRIGGKAKLKVVRWGLATGFQFLLEAFIPPRRYHRKS
jgi:glycosyltransferase involved in cell wall biosynthesis